MQKTLTLAFIAALAVGILSGCSGASDDTNTVNGGDTVSKPGETPKKLEQGASMGGGGGKADTPASTP